jgi:hypothetical protein
MTLNVLAFYIFYKFVITSQKRLNIDWFSFRNYFFVIG